MNEFFTTSSANFFCFLIAGLIIVFLTLRFDKQNRKKLYNVLLKAKELQPMLMGKSAEYNFSAINANCKDPKIERRLIEQELDELVKAYDKGLISLPEYCQKLRRLVAMTA